VLSTQNRRVAGSPAPGQPRRLPGRARRRHRRRSVRLDAQLGAAPVPALRVVADGVARLQAEPLGQRPVAPARNGQQLLGAQSLVAAQTGRAQASRNGKGTRVAGWVRRPARRMPLRAAIPRWMRNAAGQPMRMATHLGILSATPSAAHNGLPEGGSTGRQQLWAMMTQRVPKRRGPHAAFCVGRPRAHSALSEWRLCSTRGAVSPT
jgi:hypothetical protein